MGGGPCPSRGARKYRDRCLRRSSTPPCPTPTSLRAVGHRPGGVPRAPKFRRLHPAGRRRSRPAIFTSGRGALRLSRRGPAAYEVGELPQRDRLRHEQVRAEPARGTLGLGRAVTGDDDDRHPAVAGTSRLHYLEPLHPFGTRESQVRDHGRVNRRRRGGAWPRRRRRRRGLPTRSTRGTPRWPLAERARRRPPGFAAWRAACPPACSLRATPAIADRTKPEGVKPLIQSRIGESAASDLCASTEQCRPGPG